MSKENKVVAINIATVTAGGKTSIAVYVKKALEFFGFDVEVDDVDLELEPTLEENIGRDVSQRLSALAESGTKVKIKTTPLMRRGANAEPFIPKEVVQPEYITAVAVDVNGFTISLPRPARHHDIINTFNSRMDKKYYSTYKQGFITSYGRFVGREDARLIALRAGQVTEEKLSHGRELFSEDLWGEHNANP